MNTIKIIISVIIVILITTLNGCLKDKITPPADITISDSGKLLFYLEDNGDYINSDEMPSLVDADEVYSNLGTNLLIDIRPSTEFESGHIEGAHKVPHANLVSFLDSIDYTRYPKIIIISMNGQSSAYYTCLLRLYGFGNVFSMSYGMASWNNVFSDEWLNALQQDDDLLETYIQDMASKPPYGPMPEVTLSSSSLEASVKERIIENMDIDFEDNLGTQEGAATIEYQYFMTQSGNYFIVCYDQRLLYRDLRYGVSHPAGSVLYQCPPSYSDLSSTTYLQTLPADRTILFYSADGQKSAFAVAYLRVLGYDARSVLFGANNMFYNILSAAPGTNEGAFSSSKIRSYPYVTGN
jgi:rhodanese-related sulfurtransferase